MLVLIRGAGDLATGIALRLYRAGMQVVMTDLPRPTAIRRTVAFSQAIVLGETCVVLFNDTRQLICGGFVVVTIAYIEQTFVRIFRILQYTYMMRKTNAKKFH